MLGLAFVVSIFQGNFEVAVFVAGLFGVIYFSFSLYSRFLDGAELRKLTKKFLSERSGWKKVRFKDHYSESYGSLVYSPKTKEMIILKKATPRGRYSSHEAGTLVRATIVELLPKEVYQPAANVRLEFSGCPDEILCIAGSRAWNQMQADFRLAQV